MKLSLGLFLTATFLISERVSEIEYKGIQKPISIVVQRFSPAFAALEDTFHLKTDDTKINLKNITKSFDEQIVNIKSGESEIQVVQLEGLKIQRHQKIKSDTLISMTRKVASGAKNILDKTFNTQLDLSISANSFNTDTQILASNVASDPSNSSLDQAVKDIVQGRGQEIDVDGVDFVIGNPDQANSEQTKNISSNSLLSSTNLNKQSNQNIGQLLTQGMTENLKNGFGLLQQNLGPISVNSKNSVLLNPLGLNTLVQEKIRQLKGQIILTDGAVYPGERFQFYIQRVLGRTVQDRGLINPWTGEFDISVKGLSGFLTVELRHDSGALIAFGDLKLDATTLSQPETLIKVRPSENSHFIGQALSYESFDDYEVALNSNGTSKSDKKPTEIYIDGDETTGLSDEQGRFEATKIALGSQVIVSASHKGYWNSLQIAESGQPLKTILHSDKHMKSFLSLIEPYLKKAKINSVIWGRVLDQGRPIENVKVNLHGFEDIQPLYFSFRIPDPNLESTSSDGFFAFINPPEGLHIIKTDQSNMPLETTVVRLDHTSLVHVESAPKKNVTVYSFDAFKADLQVASKIAVSGMKAKWNVGQSQYSTIPFFDTSTNMVMDVEPLNSDYISTRYFIGRRRAVVNLPNFKKSWMASLLSSQRVNHIPRTTSVIGWVETGAYNVQVYPKSANTRIIYFDKLGQPAEKLIDGGGYLATNVPHGVITSTLKDSKTGQELKRLSVAEPDKVSVNYISDLNL